MNRKTLITLIAVAVVFLLGIAAAVLFLYKGDSGRRTPSVGRVNVDAQFPLLRAVPSDAVAILCMADVEDGAALLADGTKAFSALVLDGRKDSCATFVRRLGEAVGSGRLAAMRSEPMTLSLHYSGSLAPLLLFGMPSAVTVSTNMAGRGTDIKLGGNAEDLIADLDKDAPDYEQKKKEIYDTIEQNKRIVLDAGGLYVIGTERHESRRIDNQLRGRSGRQGDPGDSKFFLALDDDLMRIFGASRLSGMLTTLGLKEGEAITHPWITKALEKAQKRVEARYFEARKELLKYDDVMNEQRGVVYKQRDDLMTSTDLSGLAHEMIGDVVEIICENNIPEKTLPADWNIKGLHDAMVRVFALDITDIESWKTDESINERKAYETLLQLAMQRYNQQAEKYGPEMMQAATRQMMLGALDSVWKQHLQQMDYLQTGIGLRGYAQKNPLYEYKREALGLFKNTINNFKIMSVAYISRMELTRADVDATEKQRAEHDQALNAAGEARRNAPCPCGSGLKYKHCCGKLK